jgi:hypothetical protein
VPRRSCTDTIRPHGPLCKKYFGIGDFQLLMNRTSELAEFARIQAPESSGYDAAEVRRIPYLSPTSATAAKMLHGEQRKQGSAVSDQ